MEQKGLFKNLTSTACVLSLAFSTMNTNSTMLINGYEMPKANYSNYDETSSNPIITKINNVYVQRTSTKLEEEAKTLFGTMRDATQDERASVNRYIQSIAVDTGVNFFDIC